MKNFNLFLLAIFMLTGCYRMSLEGDAPEACSAIDCDDGDPCTEDVCNIDGSCNNVPIPGCRVDCMVDLDCEDGIDCTIDYCDSANLCQMVDFCEEPACDPEIWTLTMPAPSCSLNADSNGERIGFAWSGCGDDNEMRMGHFRPNDTADPFTPSGNILPYYAWSMSDPGTIDLPHLDWRDGEDSARLFFTRELDGENTVMTAMWQFTTGGRHDDEVIEIPYPENPIALTDIALGPDDDYGITFDMAMPDRSAAWFIRWSLEGDPHFPLNLNSNESRSPFLCPTEYGWAITHTMDNVIAEDLVILAERLLDDTTGDSDVLIREAAQFTTQEVVNANGTPMVFYKRDIDGVSQLFIGWKDIHEHIMNSILHSAVTGVAVLNSFNDEPARVSWCSYNSTTDNSTVHTKFVSPELVETEFRTVLGSSGCSDTALVRHNDEVYLLWLTNAGLSYKNLSCH